MESKPRPAYKYDGIVFIKGADLRAMRIRAGLTTVQMSMAAMVKARRSYEHWERDIGCPNINQLILMVQACEQNPAEFVQACITRTLRELASTPID
jgi:hypothetical protein